MLAFQFPIMISLYMVQTLAYKMIQCIISNYNVGMHLNMKILKAKIFKFYHTLYIAHTYEYKTTKNDSDILTIKYRIGNSTYKITIPVVVYL